MRIVVAATPTPPQLDLPVVEQQAIARARPARQLAVGREHAAGPADAVADRDRSARRPSAAESRAAFEPAGADLRAAQVLQDGHVPAGARRGLADLRGIAPRDRPACRARSSAGPRRRRRRSGRRARRARLMAGPSVAMILVCLTAISLRPESLQLHDSHGEHHAAAGRRVPGRAAPRSARTACADRSRRPRRRAAAGLSGHRRAAAHAGAACGATRILEIGTAIGYSTLWMASALPADGTLITMEYDAARAARARDHFAAAGLPTASA